jgi:serine/threonine protein kinase/tetratricopeptide (TPR) repeat protein
VVSDGGNPQDQVTRIPDEPSAGTPSAVPSQWVLRIGAYKLVRVLGEGGFGTVYLAEQERPHRRVALKVLRAGVAGPQALRRFAHEAETLALLQHAGIAQVIEAGFYDPQTGGVLSFISSREAWSSGGMPFFAMEYVEGVSITDFAKDRRLGRRERLDLVIQVCEAVQHAHAKGVIHRDLKPANILVDRAGRARVLDFGVARVTGEGVQRTMQTDIGQLVGTLGYMSPEQVAADPAQVDTRSDVYALGAVMYELLAGVPPHKLEGRVIHEAARVICESAPSPLSSIDRTLRGDLDTIVAKALERDRARRYQTPSDLAADIRRFLHDEPIVARPPSTWYQLSKFARRNKPLVAGVAASFALLSAGLVGTSYWAVRAGVAEKDAIERKKDVEEANTQLARQRDQARREADKAIAATEFLERTITAANPDEKGRDVKLADLLDEAVQQVDQEFADKPEIAAVLKAALARSYHGLGLDEEALGLIGAAVEGLVREAGADSKQALGAMLTHSRILRRLSKFEESREVAQRAVQGYERTVGPSDEFTLRAMESLAWTWADQGKYAEAEKAFKEVVDRCDAARGADDARTLRVRRLYADVVLETRNANASEAILLDVRERTVRVLGESDPSIGSIDEALAQVYRAKGDFARAIEFARPTLVEYERKYGPDHPTTLERRTTFSRTLVQAGKSEEAVAILRDVLARRTAKLGADHFDTLTTAAFLADALQNLNQMDEAIALRRTIAAARERSLGPDHPQTLVGLTNLGFVLQNAGKLDESCAVLTDVLSRRERVHGPEHQEVAVSLSMLGLNYLRQGNGAGAEPLLRRCVAIRQKLLPDGSGVRGVSLSALGESLRLQGKLADAEPLIVQGADWVLADAAAPARNRRDAVDRAVKLYDGMGQPDKAAAWRLRLEAIKR